MILLFLSIFLCASSTESLTEGDACSFSNGDRGSCALLENCPSVYQDVIAGNIPEKLCGYSGQHESIVCCPINPITTSTTSRPVNPKDRFGDGRGVLARQKCAEYSQYVYTTKFSQVGPPVKINVTECAIRSQKLISGGTKAERMEFPHMAAIGYQLSDFDIGWLCGGTLISENFVLTAAHCTYLTETGASYRGEAAWVRVGDLNLMNSDDGATPEDRRVIERINHPQYRPPAEYHDIALLRLESRVPFNAWIRPACLHTAPSTGTEKAVATGWGRVEWIDDAGSNNLLKVTLPLVDWKTCTSRWAASAMDSRLPDGVIENLSICAGNQDKDTCQGDSGGPLVIFSSQEYYCMYDVVGVTSLGKLCGRNFPGIYTRVYNYVPWIESIVWRQG